MKPFVDFGRKNYCFVLIVAAIVLYWLVFSPGCFRQKEIKIGFSGCLTGRLSDLGNSGRNGAILGIEDVNKKGGIHGRKLKLIVKDDKHDAKTANRVDMELIRKGVTAIIGHMTSSMTMAVLPLINREKMVMISPTCSTNELSGRDDYFFRVVPANRKETDFLAQLARDKLDLEELSFIYDLSNEAFTVNWYKNFREEFAGQGGRIVRTVTYTSGKAISYIKLARELVEPEPDGIVLVGGALDTAMICQQLKKIGWEGPKLAGGWSQTEELIRHGGSAVEGIYYSSTFNEQGKSDRYLKFKKQYRQRFGREPDFASVNSYESVLFLAKGLKKMKKENTLQDALKNIDTIQGLQGKIHFDTYGDSMKSFNIIVVQDGRLIPLE